MSDLINEIISAVPAEPDRRSPRWLEIKDLRSTPQQGRARAEVLEHVSIDARIMASYMSLLLRAVADCLDIASQRDNEVNRPALSATVRPTVEAAAQVWWLLDDSLTATERARRYLIWRFADLRQLRMLARDLGPGDAASDESAVTIAAQEEDLLALVKEAGWAACATTLDGPHLTAAALLDNAGKREPMPGHAELVRMAINTGGIYGLLSLPVHGTRWGVLQGFLSAETGGDATRRMAGSGLNPNTAIATALTATYRAARSLADWNRLDSTGLRIAAQELGQRVGVRQTAPRA